MRCSSLPRSPASTMPPSVMIVDDHPAWLQAVRSVVTHAFPDLHTEALTDPRAALTAVAHGRYDVMVTDLYMPELDGLAVLRRVRAMKRDTSMVLISGSFDEQIVQQAFD